MLSKRTLAATVVALLAYALLARRDDSDERVMEVSA